MRRLLAACGAAALSLAVAIPVARAVVPDSTHQLDWWTPYNQQGDVQPSTAPDGAARYGTDEVVTVRISFPDGVANWKVTLQPASGGAPSSCAESYVKGSKGFPTHIYATCPWDTTRVIARTLDNQPADAEDGDQNPTRNWHVNDQGLSVNGKYWIQVTAQSAGQPSCGLLTCGATPPSQQFELYQDPAAQRWRQVYVTNGVADPTGVKSSFDPATNRITVTWAPNPEPDASYLVQEKVGDGKWSAGVAVPGTSTNYVKAIDQPGKYQYQVAAVRPAPTGDSGNAATATTTSNYVAAQAVTIDQVTPPTTAASPNGPDGTIDTSDAGVNVPSDAPTSTAPGTHVAGAATGPAAAAGHSGGGSAGPRPGSASHPAGTALPAGGEAEGEGPDSGFSSTLPYQTQDGSTDGLGSGDEEPQSMSKLVNVPRPQDARALLVPLAGGLAMFVFAMQMTVLLRRGRPATATAEDDFDDWMTY
jgi:hypothetical protein